MDTQEALVAVFAADDGDFSRLSSDTSSGDEGLLLSGDDWDGYCDIVSEPADSDSRSTAAELSQRCA